MRHSIESGCRITAAILFLLTSFSCYPQFRGDSFQSALQTKTASLIYIYNDVTDFAKTTEQNKVKGLLIDVMYEFELYVKDQYDISVIRTYQRIDENNFQQFLKAVEDSKGGTFGLSNTSITDERKSKFQFSPPYISNISVLITHEKTQDLSMMSKINDEFGGMVAYSVPSSTYLDRLNKIKTQHYPEMEIVLLKSGIDVMTEVAKNENSFAIVDLLYYLEFYKKDFPIKRHKAGDKAGDKFGIIMPLDNDWQPIMEEFFKEFLSGPQYRKLISDHLGKSAIRLIGSGTF